MSPQTIIFSNQKGGVGKTTLTRELGVYVSSLGFKVLFVDCDPQGSLTKSLVEEQYGGLYEALSDHDIRPIELDDRLCLLCGDYRLYLPPTRFGGTCSPVNSPDSMSSNR